MTVCCECNICSATEVMGEESGDCLAPGGDLGNPAPGLATFQVLQPYGRKLRTKEPLDESERGVKKLA